MATFGICCQFKVYSDIFCNILLPLALWGTLGDFWQLLTTFAKFSQLLATLSCHVMSSCGIVPSCQLVIWSHCYIVILSYCHIGISACCHIVIMTSCHLLIFSSCHPVFLSVRYLENLSACQFVSLWACKLASFSACASWSLRACCITFVFIDHNDYIDIVIWISLQTAAAKQNGTKEKHLAFEVLFQIRIRLDTYQYHQ